VFWHIASFWAVRDFDRYRGIADFDERSARQIYGFTPLNPAHQQKNDQDNDDEA
jgi:hypothetical protein